MLDYPALAALGAVIREGSFERAASVLGITPSAVSQRIRGLEERLGAILVVRDQPCRPTEQGRILCTHLDRVELLEKDLAVKRGEGATGAVSLKVAVNADSLATWFPAAAADFAATTGGLLDLAVDDEAHTAERLRSGEVLAAVTADPRPVQGCRTLPLGALRYAACASPAFIARYFAAGIDAAALAAAPCLRFDRRDGLQAKWAAEAHDVDLAGPTQWVPSTHGFLDFALAGLAWGLQPLALAEPMLRDGRLIELPPGRRIDVRLYWTAARLPVASLEALTTAVRRSAAPILA